MLQLNFIPFPELKTQRLYLRKIKHEDAAEIFFLRSDEVILRFLGKEPAKTIKEAEEFIIKINTSIEAGESILWGIALKDEPSLLIGTICLWNIQKKNHRAEIGYVLHPAFWRRGIMKEAIHEVIEYGFKTMGLHSMEARIHADNAASAASLESAGFVKEGYLKEDFFFQDKFTDTIIYSRLQ